VLEMNLHIVPDNVFINKFYENLHESGVAPKNKLVVRTNRSRLKYVRHDLPFATLYTREFEKLVGDTHSYEKIFIHQFTPLLYRWVGRHKFKELNWMVWGSDLYNLPFLTLPLYEELTQTKYVSRRLTSQDFLYKAKVLLLHQFYKTKAYSKVSNILTWMTSEYEFAMQHLPGLKADHRFFFYENETPYKALDDLALEGTATNKQRRVFVVGNSATPELNHQDAIAMLGDLNVTADLLVPVSYGDDHYKKFLKNAVSFYKGGKVEFIETYLDFKQYLQLLNEADGLIMNNIRPQGYGNIFMMMYLGKNVFLNKKNLSIPELDRAGLAWSPLESIGANTSVSPDQNKSALMNLLSHDKLLKTYVDLFS
jgi:hypothetical protein